MEVSTKTNLTKTGFTMSFIGLDSIQTCSIFSHHFQMKDNEPIKLACANLAKQDDL